MTSPGDLRAQTRTARIAAPRLGEILISGKEGLHGDDALECSCRVCQRARLHAGMALGACLLGRGLVAPLSQLSFLFPFPVRFFLT